MGWEPVGVPVENKQAISPDKYTAAFELGLTFANRMISLRSEL